NWIDMDGLSLPKGSQCVGDDLGNAFGVPLLRIIDNEGIHFPATGRGDPFNGIVRQRSVRNSAITSTCVTSLLRHRGVEKFLLQGTISCCVNLSLRLSGWYAPK